MSNPKVSTIRREQKESLLMKEISQLFLTASLDDPNLRGLFINRVTLSPSKSVCYVFFYSENGENVFNDKLESLKLYKPSLRKAISQMKGRYAPEIVFKYDRQFEKQQKIENLLEKIKKEEKL